VILVASQRSSGYTLYQNSSAIKNWSSEIAAFTGGLRSRADLTIAEISRCWFFAPMTSDTVEIYSSWLVVTFARLAWCSVWCLRVSSRRGADENRIFSPRVYALVHLSSGFVKS